MWNKSSSKKRKSSTGTSELESNQSSSNNVKFEKYSDIPYTPPLNVKLPPTNILYQKQHKLTASVAHPKPSFSYYTIDNIQTIMYRNMMKLRRIVGIKCFLFLSLTLLSLILYSTFFISKKPTLISLNKNSNVNQTDINNNSEKKTSMLITNGVLNLDNPLDILREMDIFNDKTTYKFYEHEHTHADDYNVGAIVYLRHRVDNLAFIVASLCSEPLDDIISTITVYNNNHLATLSYDDFASSGCPRNKLHIINSDDNYGHLTKYIACSQIDVKYCFIQDDDYILPPSIIRSMRSLRDLEPDGPPIVAVDSEKYVQYKWENCLNSPEIGMHTCAYLLGSGSILSPKIAKSFVDFLGNEVEHTASGSHADEYFSIFSNSVSPSIVNVPSLCDLVQKKDDEAQASLHYDSALHALLYHLPERTFMDSFILNERSTSLLNSIKAIGDSGLVFMTNVELLPLVGARDSWNGQTTFKRWIELRRHELGTERTEEAIKSGYGAVVDNVSHTFWKSFGVAMAGDYVGFKVPYGNSLHIATTSTKIFSNTLTEFSIDGYNWTSQGLTLSCSPARMHDINGKRLFDCSTPLIEGYNYVRFLIMNDLEDSIEWSINEAWMN